MKWTEIISRVTGLTLGPVGISFQPPEAEAAVARRILAFLEDRRVLYAPGELQAPSYCSQSVLQIRTFLTTEIGQLDSESQLVKDLRQMREACRTFLDFAQTQNDWQAFDPTFSVALGQLRGVFGKHVARIAVQYKLDVEDELATIFPARDEPKC